MERINLKSFLEEHNKTQQQFIEIADVAYTSFLKYTRNEAMQKKTIEKIEKACNKIKNGITTALNSYMPAKMPVNDVWRYLPTDIRFIAMDYHGEIYGYREEPKRVALIWESTSYTSAIGIQIDFETDDWKNTLCKRPVNYQDFIGKFGIFKNKIDRLGIFAKLEAINLQLDKPFISNNGYSFDTYRPLTNQERQLLAETDEE